MIRFVLLNRRGRNGCGRRAGIGVVVVVAGSVTASGSLSGDVSGTTK